MKINNSKFKIQNSKLTTLFRKWLLKLLSQEEVVSAKTKESEADMECIDAEMVEEKETHETEMIPYDENLMERSRTQWQFGDWESLGKLDRQSVQHHPERAKLILLAASAHAQLGDDTKAREFTKLSLEWGCSKKLVSQIMISGVYNSLGSASIATDKDKNAISFFETALDVVDSKKENTFLGESRAVRQATKLGLLPKAMQYTKVRFGTLQKDSALNSKSHIDIVKTEIELMQHELSIALQRNQLFHSQRTTNTSSLLIGSDEWLADLKQRSVSQLGQDIWVLEKTDFKRNGFFVEFGATNGILLSNTYLLEKEFDWQGICAEPNPGFFEELKNNRDCIVSNECIGAKTGEKVKFVFAQEYGGMQKHMADDSHKDKRQAYLEQGHEMELETISLHDFLVKHNAPKQIDYLSIDTEGSEYEILENFPFEEWDIALMSVEHNFTEDRKKIRGLLESQGFKCVETQWDDWYYKDELNANM